LVQMKIRSFILSGLMALLLFFGLSGLGQAQSLVYQGQICWQNVSSYDQVVVHFQPNGRSDWDSNMTVNGVTIASTGHGSNYSGQSGYVPGNGISLGWVKVGGCSTWFCASYNANINYGQCNPTFEDTGVSPNEGYFWFEGYKYIRPTLSVSKSAVPYTLNVGASGQYYSIYIGVANGPTTAAISIVDTLPAGFTTSDAITATGGSLYGCPLAGASNLSGCTIAAGAYGPITITVPVNISSAAASSATNYAYVYGGGDPNCAGGCVGGTTNPVTPASPTLNITKALSGNRLNTSDQFTVQILNGTQVVNSATTSGSGSIVNTGSIGATTLTAGTSYTIKEVAAGSTTLAQYQGTVGNCSGTGSSKIPSAPGSPFTLANGDAITCTLTNTVAVPTISVAKSLGGNRAVSTDQFTLQLLQNSAPLSLPGNGTTTGLNAAVDSGTGATGRTTLTAGSTYNVSEVGTGSTNLARYTKTLTCSNGVNNYPLALGGSFTAQNGDNIVCTLQNDPIAPTLSLSKALGGNRYASGDQFTVQILRNGTVVNTTTNSTTAGNGSAVNAGSGTTGTFTGTANTSYTLNEVGASGADLAKYTSRLSCQINGDTPQSMNLGDAITPIAGDSYVCTITNTPLAPTIALRKQLLSSRVNDSDQFAVQINAGSTVASATTGGSGSTVTAGATGAYTATVGTIYTLTEVPSGTTRLAQYTTAMTCSNSYTVLQGGTDVSGINSIGATITPKAGDVIDCVIKNQQAPSTLALTQNISGGSGVPPAVTFDYSGTNGWGNRPVTSNSEGYGTPGPAITLSSNGVETVLTVTLLPGWQLNSVNCGEANGGAYFGTKDGNSLRIPAANVVAGAVINCSMDMALAAPTIVVNKLLGGNRISNNDQFTVQLKTGATVASSGTNSAGLGSSVSTGTGTTGILTATAGTVYNIGEVMAGGSDSSLAQYGVTVGCSNAHLPLGSGTNLGSVQLLGDTFSLKAGDVITCNITNAPKAPKLELKKVLGLGGRINAADQFRVVIFEGSGWAGSATTSGSGGTVIGGATAITANLTSRYMIGEEMVAGSVSNIEQYAHPLDCQNALSVGIGGTAFSPGTLGLGQTFGPLKPGDDISCTITNTPKLPTITLDQFVAGGIKLPAIYEYTGTNGWTTKSATSTQGGTPGTPTPVQSLTSAAVSTDLTPTLPPGLRIAFAYCADTNYQVSGNTGGNFGSYTDTTFTVPENNIKFGSTLVCHVQLGFTQSKLTINKTTTAGTGTFTFSGSASHANGFGTSVTYSVSTSTAGTPASGSTVTLAANNVVTEVLETVPAGWVLMSASCTDKNSGVTNKTDNFGTLDGTKLTIAADSVNPGADLQCLFTNAPIPTITLDQFVAGGIDVPAKYNYTGNNGWTAKDVTSVQAGVWGQPTPVQSLTGAGVETVLTPTLSPGLKITNAYCTDTNYLKNGNSGGTFGSFTDGALTIAANNLKGGSVLVCHVEIGFAKAKMTIQKATTVGAGTFTFNGVVPNANGLSTNSSYSITTATAGTPVKGSAVTLTANNALTQIQETQLTAWMLVSASCIDNNSGVTHNTGNFGTLINGTTLQIPDTKVSPGADLLCTFTNAPKVATLALTQNISGGSGVPPAVTFDYSGNNGWGSRPVTSNSEGYGTPGPTITLAANGAETVLTVTPLPGWQLNSVNCGDANGGYNSNGGTSFGTKDGNSLRIPAANVVAGAAINCSMDLGLAPPTIVVNKLMGSNRISDSDQFTVQLKTGSAVAFSGTSTAGQGSAVSTGTGTTGIYTATPGTVYNVGEVMAAGSDSSLGKYRAGVVCSNTHLPAGTGTNLSSVAKLGDTFSLKAGDVITCNLTNDLGLVTLTLTQLIISPFPVNLLPPFTFNYTINNGWPVQSQPLTTNTLNVPVSTPARMLSASNVDTTLSTNLPDARWFVSSFACVDTNAAISGNRSGNLVRVVGTNITIPAGNVRPGSTLKCTLTMGHKVP
jgi:hypothetical protein